MHERKEATKEDIEKNKAVAALSYLWILFLVPLFTAKDSAYAHFHAKQGLVLFIGWIILTILWIIPPIAMLGYLFLIILCIIGLVNALSGKMVKLPLIGDFADKFNI